MTLECIRAALDSERAVLELLEARSRLRTSGRNATGRFTTWTIANTFTFAANRKPILYFAEVILKLTANLRTFVEDCVRKWGYDATAIPYDHNSY
jgi:hypothetical protein